jgi:hypothetical protein
MTRLGPAWYGGSYSPSCPAGAGHPILISLPSHPLIIYTLD